MNRRCVNLLQQAARTPGSRRWGVLGFLLLNAIPGTTAAAATRGPFIEPGTAIFGSVVDARAQVPGSNAKEALTPRGLVVRVGPGHWAVFDVDLLRWTAFWTGDGVTSVSMSQGSYAEAVAGQKAPEGQGLLPSPQGQVMWLNGPGPGWHHGSGPAWGDDRVRAPDPEEVGLGPMPYRWGRMGAWGADSRGAWVEYDVGGSLLRERLSVRGEGARAVWIREWEGDACPVERRVMLGRPLDPAGKARVIEAGGGETSRIHAQLEQSDGRFMVRLPPSASRWKLSVALEPAGRDLAGDAVPSAPESRGRPVRRWPETVVTRVDPGSQETNGVVIDPIGLPLENPWRRHVRLADLAFRADGRAAGVTFDGDVWWMDGLGEGSGRVTWRRFATGFHEPLSLLVRSNRVEVFDRNGIWRLRDEDGDDECERVELVSHAFCQTAETREFANSMELDADGAYLIAKGGQQGSTTGRHNGMVLRVREGEETPEVLAYGLRQPFLAVHPRTGWITATDQQGHYVPTTPIHEIREGRYHGFLSLRLPKEQYPAAIAEPLVWVPHAVNASAASQVWLLDSRMGALEGALVHLGYYRPELFVVRLNRRSDVAEAAVMSLTRDLSFAPLNGAVNPRDGLLYLCGFQIWGTEARETSGLARVRPSPREGVPLPDEVAAFRDGLLLRFGMALDPDSASDPSRYFVECWNYRRSAQYGSGHYRWDGTRGQEVLRTVRVRLSRDRKAVWLEVPGLKPVMQMRVAWTLRDSAGRALSQSACLTPRALPAFESAREGFDEIADLPGVPVGVAAPEPIAQVTPVTAEEGRRLAELMGCVACHSTDGSIVGKVGPSWKGLMGSRRRFVDGTEAIADEAYLRQSMEDPAARVVQGFDSRDTGMPSYAGVLTPDQQSALIAYLATLR